MCLEKPDVCVEVCLERFPDSWNVEVCLERFPDSWNGNAVNSLCCVSVGAKSEDM